MESLKNELFDIMSPNEIENFLNDSFEAYLKEWGAAQTNLHDCHAVKRILIEIINDMNNSKLSER